MTAMLAKCLLALSATMVMTTPVIAQAGSQRTGPQKTKFDPEVLNRAGTYHALIIGNNDYQHLPKLETAVKDAQDLADILKVLYGFEVKLLLNATRNQIMSSISEYRRTLDDSANLLIYYAGHGELDRGADRAYWLPVDAEKENKANWISADDVTGDLRAMPSRHVLIIADSCYSGAMRDAHAQITPEDKNRFLLQVKAKKSRTLMTSGAIEPVADGGGAVNSVFAEALIQGLSGIDDAAFSAGTLFSDFVRIRVGGRARQTPLYSPLVNSGDQGGDFVFLRTAHSAMPPASTSNTALELHNRGSLYSDDKKWPEAEAEYQKAVALEPGNAIYRSKLGSALYEQRKYAEAEAAYREASRLDPKNASYLNSVGNCLTGQNRGAEAEALYKQGLAIDPQHFWLNHNLADRLNRQGEYKAAEPYATKAAELAPKNFNAQKVQAENLAGLKQMEAAEAAFHRALEIDPKSATAWNELGNLQYGNHNYKASEASYRSVVQLNSTPNTIDHSNLAGALFQLGKYDEAEASAKEALQLSADNYRGNYWLGRVQFVRKQFSDAEHSLRRAAVLESGIADRHYWLGATLAAESRWEEAVLEYKEAIRLTDAPYYHSNLAVAYTRLNRVDLAESAYKDGIALAPADLELRRYYGGFLYQQKRYEEAKAVATLTLDQEPGNWVNHQNMGVVLLVLKDFAKAEAELRRSIELKADEATPYAKLGEALEGQGKLADAMQAYEQSAKLAPSGDGPAQVQRLKAKLAEKPAQL
jgi:tetratricopeptide (TPR) repeat protein